jgi:hypothetical protein
VRLPAALIQSRCAPQNNFITASLANENGGADASTNRTRETL